MQFPPWVDGPHKTKQERASGRLKFILATLAVQTTSRQSMRALAERVQIDHSTLCKYVKQGFFSRKAAIRMEVALGKKMVSINDLTNPMSIEKS